MKITNKLFEEIISKLVGEEVIELAKLVKAKKTLSEFRIAELLELELNEVRNLLYKLYHINLVSFNKRKDQKKGWYVYYWTFKPKQMKFALNTLNKIKLEEKKNHMFREQDATYFVCNNSCLRLEFEQALHYEYKCPECGTLMEHHDNTEIITSLESQIKSLENSIF